MYVLNPYENVSYSTESFKVAELKCNKWQKVDSDFETYICHLRLGHINLNRINRLTNDGLLRQLTVGTLFVYESCSKGKMTKRPFSAKGQRATQPSELVHQMFVDHLMHKLEEVINTTSLLLTIIEDTLSHI